MSMMSRAVTIVLRLDDECKKVGRIREEKDEVEYEQNTCMGVCRAARIVPKVP